MIFVISYRLHRAKEVVLAMADLELLGKTFKEGDSILEVSSFFKENKAKPEEIGEIIKKATIINAVGKQSTKAVIKAGLASDSNLKHVKGIPHIQVIFM